MAVGAPNILYDSGATSFSSGSLTSSSFTPAGGANDAIFVVLFTAAHTNLTGGGSATFSTDGAATDIADHGTPFLGRGIATWVLTGPTATSQTVAVSAGSGFSEDVRVLVFEMSGVDQTTPNDTAVTDDGDGAGSLTQDISSATDDRVVSFVINQTNDPTPEGTAIGTDVEYETGWYAGAQHVAGASPTVSCDWTNLSGLSAGIWFNVNAAAGAAPAADGYGRMQSHPRVISQGAKTSAGYGVTLTPPNATAQGTKGGEAGAMMYDPTVVWLGGEKTGTGYAVNLAHAYTLGHGQKAGATPANDGWGLLFGALSVMAQGEKTGAGFGLTLDSTDALAHGSKGGETHTGIHGASSVLVLGEKNGEAFAMLSSDPYLVAAGEKVGAGYALVFDPPVVLGDGTQFAAIIQFPPQVADAHAPNTVADAYAPNTVADAQ